MKQSSLAITLSIICLCCLAIFFTSCRKDKILTQGGSVSFSKDTLTFDTVFTAQGSATREIKIFNEENLPIKLSSVRLGKGGLSAFTLNVDGKPGTAVQDIEIAPNDSIFVFASVKIDPNNANTPFVVEDELIATLNDRDFSVPIIAFGQNAIYIYDSVLTTQTWTSTKPYVIINNALVDSGETLTLQPGTRIYNHANSRLFVDGTLLANGTKQDSIIFQGDRIDRRYFDYLELPGEWGGIYFTSNSTGNQLTHVTIKNGGNSSVLGNSFIQPASIQVDRKKAGSSTVQLSLNKVRIQNSLGYGILSFGGEIYARNSLFIYSGAQCFAGIEGGAYVLENCTIGGYGTTYLKHTDNPAFALLNYLELSTGITTAPLYARINNCIIYGTLENEMLVLKKGSGSYDVAFKNGIYKVKQSDLDAAAIFSAGIYNTEPGFEDTEKWDFHLKQDAAARNAGVTLVGFSDDLDDQPRIAPWDLGCYEKQ